VATPASAAATNLKKGG